MDYLRNQSKQVQVTFSWPGQDATIESVCVAGSFNSWNREPLEKKSENFEAEFAITPGRYHYKFVIDGSWKYDAEAPFEMDEYGNINNVLEIQGSDAMDDCRGDQLTRRPSCELDREYGLSSVAMRSIGGDSPAVVEPSPSILLSARTQHFGGDLSTMEHERREQRGGHRSVIETHGTTALQQTEGKLVIALVGLPGRGKTFVGKGVEKHLKWMGHRVELFNVGDYRRKLFQSNISHKFFDRSNEESMELRLKAATKCIHDALQALRTRIDIAIYDATNITVQRRRLVRKLVEEQKIGVMFVEVKVDDPQILKSTFRDMTLASLDYENWPSDKALVDFERRISHYTDSYETMTESENASFIKVINGGQQVHTNKTTGFMQGRVVFLLLNLNLNSRPIWLCRHGQSIYNTEGKIGGDSGLSQLGMKFRGSLAEFINKHYPEGTELAVWTSTMKRTGQTVEPLAAAGRKVVKWRQLDEIDAGVCDGMTYEEVAEKMPEEYLLRKERKLEYRYPRGESYQDVIHRLEPVIIELQRIKTPLLIVAHQAILRVIYGYLANKNPDDCPTIDIPLHTIIQVTPKAYACEEVWHNMM